MSRTLARLSTGRLGPPPWSRRLRASGQARPASAPLVARSSVPDPAAQASARSAARILSSAACSLALTGFPPIPMKPPSRFAFAAASATVTTNYL